MLAGCVGESSSPSWDEFKTAATRTFDDQPLYVVEGDMAVDEGQLRDLYLLHYEGIATATQESIVNRVGGRDDIWRNNAQMNLTYCVSNEFGQNKARVVSEMASATAAWEAVARVNFVYNAAHDNRCRNSNRNVTFSVRPWTSGGACAFFPSGGGCVARTLVIDIFDLDNNYGDVAPNVRTVGVFRHELGHILGLRHEHTRPESGVCFENTAWRSLTPYDRGSVMHYPWCNGMTASTLAITSADATGAAALYGAP